MLGRERFAIVIERKQHVGAQEILQGNVGRIALFCQYKGEFRAGLRVHKLQYVPEQYPAPAVIETAPARDTVKIGAHVRLRQSAEFLPSEPNGLFDQTADLEIPL